MRLTGEADPIEDFSLAANSEPSFPKQVTQLIRKKILMQLRDQKTLLIDVLFPIILILVGLALATIAIFTRGPDRDLTMSVLYPDVPNTFVYNENALSGSEVLQ